MSIKSEIIADSINSCGNRITSFILEYPRFIHAEVMTHRVFSKNAASSRAIPIEKMIQQVIDNPAMPVLWGKNQSGMQSNEELDDDMKLLAKAEWLVARDEVIISVRNLNSLGLHKQITNRILEPWFNIRIILTGTEFQNFFALRAHKDAQPELQFLANLMLEQYNKSIPNKLTYGEWHIPFGDNMDEAKIESLVKEQVESHTRKGQIGGLGDTIRQDLKRKISVARCARISYFNYEGKDDYKVDIKLCDRLFGNSPKHLSPTEHIAMALDNSERIGNYIGWKQYRKFFNDENLIDSRVIDKL